jgi:hypothetical protein
VIDIQHASLAPGALLEAYPMKSSLNANQLWRAVGGVFPSTKALPVERKTGGSRDPQRRVEYE